MRSGRPPAQTIMRKLRFQWDTPIYLATINATPMYIGTNRADPKFTSFEGMLDFARKNPGALNMAQIGKAGLHEVTMLRIKKRFGVDFKSIPFNGGPRPWRRYSEAMPAP